MKILITFFLLTATSAHAEVVDMINHGQLKHFKIKYKIDAKKDLQVCKDNWHLGYNSSQGNFCRISYYDFPGYAPSGIKFTKQVEVSGVTIGLTADWRGVGVVIKGFNSDDFEDNKIYVEKALALAENYEYEASVFMQDFTATDPHIVSVTDGNSVVAVERQFPKLDLEVCGTSWVANQNGYRGCKMKHFEDMNNMESLGSDRWAKTFNDDGRIFEVNVSAYKSEFKVYVMPRSNPDGLPREYNYFKPYINEVLKNAEEAGIDFKIIVMAPQGDYKDQSGQSDPFALDVIQEFYKFRMSECAEDWQGFNDVDWAEGYCEMKYESPLKNVYDLRPERKEYSRDGISRRESATFYFKIDEPHDFVNLNVFRLSIDTTGEYTHFLFDNALPIIERALKHLGTDTFEKYFYAKSK